MRTKTGRNGGFGRQWAIYQTLQRYPFGLGAVNLANYAGVSVRTIYRDLEVMGAAGVPIVNVPIGDKNVIWRLMARDKDREEVRWTQY